MYEIKIFFFKGHFQEQTPTTVVGHYAGIDEMASNPADGRTLIFFKTMIALCRVRSCGMTGQRLMLNEDIYLFI